MKNAIIQLAVNVVLALTLLLIGSSGVWADPVPTTLQDFFLPGSQPFQSGTLPSSSFCDNCHGGYNQVVEPAFTWRGGMMSQAMRDPLFLATMTIANQDAPSAGDLCIRCHTPAGWLEGRSDPPDGSALTVSDRESVQCSFCHRLVKPAPLGSNPYPLDSMYTANTLSHDQLYLATLNPIPQGSANGMYLVDSDPARRGPYWDAEANHAMYYSPFHRDAALCGSCHDVSNPVFTGSAGNSYVPNAFGQPAPNFDLRTMFPVERTFSEWSVSAYNSPAGVYAPQFGGNKDYVSTCQDCHMKDVTGQGANKSWVPTRSDLPLHDQTGGNTFIPNLIESVYPGESDPNALAAGIQRATYMLQNAATMTLEIEPQGSNYLAHVQVTNQTGHKLPSGYPEGRRIWINVRAYNTSGNLVYESGSYDSTTGILLEDPELKTYQIKPGVSSSLAPVVNLPAGPSFHFVLNDTIYNDNRIPPRGFNNASFAAIQSPPVGYNYPDGQYWDQTNYLLPGSASRVYVTLYYQTTSKEYVEFLRDENTTDNWGDTMYALWNTHGRSQPVAMVSASDTLEPPAPAPLEVELAPLNPPIVIPAQGGSFQFNISIVNLGPNQTPFSVWARMKYPNGTYTPPSLGPVTINPPVNVTIMRARSQNIPGTYPTGEFTYLGYVNWIYSYPAVDSSSFTFTKSALTDNGPTIWDAICSGELLPGEIPAMTAQPASYRVNASPNPFNPATTISYQLQAASHVSLRVFNTAGRQIVTLAEGWQEAGNHEVPFDGSGLASGLYFVRMQAGKYTAVQKMMLLK